MVPKKLIFVGLLILLATQWIAAGEPKSDQSVKVNAKDGAQMVLIPRGHVNVGSEESEVDEHFRRFGYQPDWKKYALPEIPRHRLEVKPFYLSKYEVTNGQYQKFIAATAHAVPAHWKDKSTPLGKENHPVVGVSWEDARAYCGWAGTRLPTEVEWEYAARGPAMSADEKGPVFPWGDDWDRTRANSASHHFGKDIVDNVRYQEWSKNVDPASHPLTTPVGSFEKGASRFGIHDLAGNAWEWCSDPYAPYFGSPAGVPEADANSHVCKGGCWANVSFHLRCADRRIFAADAKNLYIGFRCARDADGKE